MAGRVVHPLTSSSQPWGCGRDEATRDPQRMRAPNPNPGPGFGVAGDEVGRKEPQPQHEGGDDAARGGSWASRGGSLKLGIALKSPVSTEPSLAEESFIPVPLLNKVSAIS